MDVITYTVEIRIALKETLPQVQIINSPPEMPSSVNNTNFLTEKNTQIN